MLKLIPCGAKRSTIRRVESEYLLPKSYFKVFKLEHGRESFIVRPKSKIPLLSRFVRYCINEIHVINGQLTFHGHAVIGTTPWFRAKNVEVNPEEALLDEHVYTEVMRTRREQLELID